jgi:hypothetical protein
MKKTIKNDQIRDEMVRIEAAGWELKHRRRRIKE